MKLAALLVTAALVAAERPGRPGRKWQLGDPLPSDDEILPGPKRNRKPTAPPPKPKPKPERLPWNHTTYVPPAPPPWNDTRYRVALFGIPRAATRSFTADAARLFGEDQVPVPRSQHHPAERCSYGSNVEAGRRTITMLREPASLVQALYYHCATADREFVGGRSTQPLAPTFDAWVAGWAGAVDQALAANANGTRCPRHVKHRFMPCFNPVDTLTYALSCRGGRALEYQARRSWPPEGSRGARVNAPKGRDRPTLANPPDLCAWLDERDVDRAAERLERQAFVGIAELYDESMCVLEYVQTGTLPFSCRCELRARRSRSRITKETAPHDVADISNATRALIASRLAAFDAPLYDVARRRLVAQVRYVEAQTGASILCGDGVAGPADEGFSRSEHWSKKKHRWVVRNYLWWWVVARRNGYGPDLVGVGVFAVLLGVIKMKKKSSERRVLSLRAAGRGL